jgi:hypothetical protein
MSDDRLEVQVSFDGKLMYVVYSDLTRLMVDYDQALDLIDKMRAGLSKMAVSLEPKKP